MLRDPILSLFAPYQLDWLADPAARKLLVKSRRIGGSFVVAFEIALAALGLTVLDRKRIGRAERGPVSQFLVSASQSQANALLATVHQHLRALAIILKVDPIQKASTEQLVLHLGTVIRAFAASSRTIRGSGGDLTIDEAGVLPDPENLWKAAKSIPDATLGKRGGYQLRIIGSPCGDDASNLLWRCAYGSLSSTFSKHTVDIYTAIAQGFPADVERIREECGSSDVFDEEYACEFLSASSRYISEELFDACVYAADEAPGQDAVGVRRFGGYDVARSPSGDNAALVQGYRVPNEFTLWVEEVTLRRGLPWDAQEVWIGETVRGASRVAIDATGMGSMFAERLTNVHGSKVVSVNFSSSVERESVFTGLRIGFEKRRIRVPKSASDLRRNVLSLKREVTTNGNVRFALPRSKRGGHGDAAVALALCAHACGGMSDEQRSGGFSAIATKIGVSTPGKRGWFKYW